jgi:hypothetical protein
MFGVPKFTVNRHTIISLRAILSNKHLTEGKTEDTSEECHREEDERHGRAAIAWRRAINGDEVGARS